MLLEEAVRKMEVIRKEEGGLGQNEEKKDPFIPIAGGSVGQEDAIRTRLLFERRGVRVDHSQRGCFRCINRPPSPIPDIPDQVPAAE